MGHNDNNTIYIFKPGLYAMIFGTQENEAKIFKWVCSKVLPSIMTYWAYITTEKAIELFNLIDNDEAETLRDISNPRGETNLHYGVVSYI